MCSLFMSLSEILTDAEDMVYPVTVCLKAMKVNNERNRRKAEKHKLGVRFQANIRWFRDNQTVFQRILQIKRRKEVFIPMKSRGNQVWIFCFFCFSF